MLPMGHMLGGKTNATNINDERSAAKKAEAVLNSLVPSSPRTNAQLDTLRQTADIANAVIIQNNFSSQTGQCQTPWGGDGRFRFMGSVELSLLSTVDSE